MGREFGLNVSQTGDYNNVSSTQFGSANAMGLTGSAGAYGTDTPVTQTGEDNQITILQVGNNGTVNAGQFSSQ